MNAQTWQKKIHDVRLLALALLAVPIILVERFSYFLIMKYARLLRSSMNGFSAVGVMGTARTSASMRERKQKALSSGELAKSTRYEKAEIFLEHVQKVAENFGTRLGREGSFSLTTGGCDGAPGAALRGFVNSRQQSHLQLATGIRIRSLTFREDPAPGLDIIIHAADFFIRLAFLVFLSPGGVVVFPGGVGSRLELYIWMQLIQVTPWKVPVIVLNINEHYTHLQKDFEQMCATGLADAEQLPMLHFVETEEEACRILLEFRQEQHKKQAAA